MPRVAKKDIRPVAPNPIPPAVIPKPWSITVQVDWGTLAMPEAQQAYAQLKSHFEKAGAILNARAMPTDNKYVCYMAGKDKCCPVGVVHDGQPRFIDYSRKNPKTGLMEVVKICSENCSIRYNNVLIEERREKYAPKRGE
jgi:hypothetical protein